jgi:hypothetical protein
MIILKYVARKQYTVKRPDAWNSTCILFDSGLTGHLITYQFPNMTGKIRQGEIISNYPAFSWNTDDTDGTDFNGFMVCFLWLGDS